MKKLFCILICFLLLCGCKEKVSKPIKNCSFKSYVYSDNFKYVLRGEKQSDKITITVVSPENIKGTCYTVEKGEISTQFMGISLNRKSEDYPESSLIKIIYEASKELSEDNLEFSGDNITVKFCDVIEKNVT